MDKQISHTNHMSNLFMQGLIWESMHFEEIAHIMTLNGLDTTESEAMDAYDNCILLSYPIGGSPLVLPRIGNNVDLTDETPEEVEDKSEDKEDWYIINGDEGYDYETVLRMVERVGFWDGRRW